MTEIRLVGTDAVLGWTFSGRLWWWAHGQGGKQYGPYPTLCAAWNALHLAYAEREMA